MRVSMIKEDTASLIDADPFDLAAMLKAVDEQSHRIADIRAIRYAKTKAAPRNVDDRGCTFIARGLDKDALNLGLNSVVPTIPRPTGLHSRSPLSSSGTRTSKRYPIILTQLKTPEEIA